MGENYALEFAGATPEKGWGMFFDLRHGEELLRFSVSRETLSALQPTARLFTDAFEAHLSLILKAACMLVRMNRLRPSGDIGGTEVELSHLRQAEHA